MLHIKSCINNTIIKYGIIIGILFSVLLLMCNYLLTINNQLSKERENISYRTILVAPSNVAMFKESLNQYKEYIESVENEDNEYCIIFKKYDYVSDYLNKYSNIFSKTAINNEDVNNKYSFLKNVIYSLVIIISLIVIFLIFIFSYNIIFNIENDIALYKLIGYKNKNIIVTLCVSLYIYYFVLFVISYSVVYVLYFAFLNKVSIINGIQNMMLLNVYHLLGIWLIINIPVLCSYIRIINRINNITPITFIKGE